MKQKRIASEWEEYKNNVEIKLHEDEAITSRDIFYAGAISLFHVILHDLTPDAEPTEEDLRMIAELDQEMKAYAQELKGRVMLETFFPKRR